MANRHTASPPRTDDSQTPMVAPAAACHDGRMSVSHEADPGCSALGHLFRPEGDHKVCITCGYVQERPETAPEE